MSSIMQQHNFPPGMPKVVLKLYPFFAPPATRTHTETDTPKQQATPKPFFNREGKRKRQTDTQSTHSSSPSPSRFTLTSYRRTFSHSTLVSTLTHYVQSHVAAHPSSVGRSILSLLDHLSLIVQRPYDRDLQRINVSEENKNNSWKDTLITHASLFQTQLSPLLYALGFERERNVYVLTVTASALNERLTTIRQEVTDWIQIHTTAVSYDSLSNKQHAVISENTDTSSLDTTQGFDVCETSDAAAADDDEDEWRHSSGHRRSALHNTRVRVAPTPHINNKTAVIHNRNTFKESYQYTHPRRDKHTIVTVTRPSSTSLYQDVSGQSRSQPVPLPASFIADAPKQPNVSYLTAALSAADIQDCTVDPTDLAQLAVFTTFSVQPAALDFGAVRQGAVYSTTIAITNVGAVTGRYTVVPPTMPRDSQCQLHVHHRPGLLAAGLQKKMSVELMATTTGELTTEIVIKTESHIHYLPVHAHIMDASEYAQWQQQYDSAVRGQFDSDGHTARAASAAIGYTRSGLLPHTLKQIRSRIGKIRVVQNPLQAQTEETETEESKEQMREHTGNSVRETSAPSSQ